VYQMTVFNQDGSKVYSENVMGYPADPVLEEGQWFDICRVTFEIDDHEFVWDNDDWLVEYMLGELFDY